jgi:hypothetical protein
MQEQGNIPKVARSRKVAHIVEVTQRGDRPPTTSSREGRNTLSIKEMTTHDGGNLQTSIKASQAIEDAINTCVRATMSWFVELLSPCLVGGSCLSL